MSDWRETAFAEDCEVCWARAGEACYLQAPPPELVKRSDSKFAVHHNRSGLPWTAEELNQARRHRLNKRPWLDRPREPWGCG